MVNGQELGIVEAKKLTLGPQNVLSQSERYSRGAEGCPFDFDGFHIPFLYSTNGEVRHPTPTPFCVFCAFLRPTLPPPRAS